jgi:hypothetical protein
VPDYLRQQVKRVVNRGGFCFGFRPTAIDDVCYLDVYFQNQQDKPCVGRVALRPARGFFLSVCPISGLKPLRDTETLVGLRSRITD